MIIRICVPLNVLRNLSAIADLIEVCFSPTIDNDGQRYLSDGPRQRDDSFLHWASRMTETFPAPDGVCLGAGGSRRWQCQPDPDSG